jgi:hypothetical protein
MYFFRSGPGNFYVRHFSGHALPWKKTRSAGISDLSMTQSWDRLSGASIAGKYVLERWLGGGEEDAFFLTRFGSAGAPAVLKLVREEPSGAEAQLARWRRTACLSHPNVLGLYDCGRAGLVAKSADASYLYAVFEYPDDNLAPALEHGALSEAETLDVLRAVLDGLRYIHAQKLVHGAIDPAHIVAVGERIKLASDTVREPGGSFTPQEDIRALGNVLQVLLGMPELTSISDPLGSIIRHATDPSANRRWTLDEIGAFLDPPGKALIEPEPPRRAAWTPPRLPVLPKWAYAAAVVFLVVAVFAVTRKSGPQKPAPVPDPAPAQSQPRSIGSAPQPVPPKAAAPGKAERAHREPGRAWRVIAYTYSGFKAAEKKAHTINQKYPAFHAEVFSPRGRNTSPYLVALGGRMTRDEAVRLQRSARARGLPRDTFIRNYSD